MEKTRNRRIVKGIKKDPRPGSDALNKKARLILNAARKVFCEQGYDGASTDTVAHTAGVSKATLYAHFRSKKALLVAVIEDEMRSFAADLAEEVVPPPGPLDVPAALRRIAERQLSFFLSRRDFSMRHLIESITPRFPDIGQMFWAAGPGKMREEVATFLRAAAAEGKLNVPDPDLAAMQFLSLARGDFPVIRLLLPDQQVREAAAKQVEGALRVFLAAYGIPPRHDRN